MKITKIERAVSVVVLLAGIPTLAAVVGKMDWSIWMKGMTIGVWGVSFGLAAALMLVTTLDEH